MNAISMTVAIGGALAGGLIDARTGHIPNAISRGTALFAFAVALVAGNGASSAWGAALLGGMLFALYAVTLGAGLGLGDVKLGIAIGAGFGPHDGAIALATAFVAGGAYAVWLLRTRRARRGDAIRFGPFLAAGSLAAGVFAVVTR